jgi:DNA repair protein RadC
MRKSQALSAILGQYKCRFPESLTDIAKLSIDAMIERGVRINDARKIHAAIRLAREIAEPATQYRTLRITSPFKAMEYCRAEFTALANHSVQEEFWVVTLNTKNQPIGTHQITVGTLRNSPVHPREVFRPAIADAANCIIACHNHPSGDPTPSDQDLSVTERLESAAEIIGIPVIDHIVVAGDKAISIQEWRSGNRW